MAEKKSFGLKLEDVRQQTEVAKADVDKACDLAFDHITKDAENDVEKAMGDGRTRAYLYRWKYEEDASKKTYAFAGIRIMDILTKGDLVDRLNDYFNPDGEDGFRVGWHKFRNTSPTEYGLYVSWYKPKEEADED
jgi:hypothetical protein